MPIRGDRLRWPPRPGKKASEGTRRVLPTDKVKSADEPKLRQPDERDQTASHHAHTPGTVIKRAHDDIEQGREDTDCRNRAAEVTERGPAAGVRKAPPSRSGR
jgi:hypothetical protein